MPVLDGEMSDSDDGLGRGSCGRLVYVVALRDGGFVGGGGGGRFGAAVVVTGGTMSALERRSCSNTRDKRSTAFSPPCENATVRALDCECANDALWRGLLSNVLEKASWRSTSISFLLPWKAGKEIKAAKVISRIGSHFMRKFGSDPFAATGNNHNIILFMSHRTANKMSDMYMYMYI